MIYLHDGHIRDIGIDWNGLTATVEEIVAIKDGGDCVHPLKPYLRFGEPVNRIIAMPAYVGGSIQMAGIKWVASFPNNHLHGLPRAHNMIILNDPQTGAPVAMIHSGLLNGLRTAAVSGLVLKAYMKARRPAKLRVGIVGWGPVGRLHLDMCARLLGGKLERITLYDMRGVDPDTVPEPVRGITDIADDWRAAYRSSDVFATCTVSDQRYIDEAPAEGMLLLNISLRDYMPASVSNVKAVVVDDWTEVCRENTDIEQLHRSFGLKESDVITLADVVSHGALASLDKQESVFFNPMGLAVFDIGVAAWYWREALRQGTGIVMEQAPQR